MHKCTIVVIKLNWTVHVEEIHPNCSLKLIIRPMVTIFSQRSKLYKLLDQLNVLALQLQTLQSSIICKLLTVNISITLLLFGNKDIIMIARILRASGLNPLSCNGCYFIVPLNIHNIHFERYKQKTFCGRCGSSVCNCDNSMQSCTECDFTTEIFSRLTFKI
jgi:hypothetical protein